MNGRSNVGYSERIDVELYFVKNKLLSLDMLIILRTFAKVLLRWGAY